jgi:dimethylamine/trimethylamine dehydrogenase
MAGALAEQLAKQGRAVTYVTTAGSASAWTFMTNELPLIHRALGKAGVPILTLRRVAAFDGECATLADVYTGSEQRVACRSLLVVGMRKPNDDLYHALMARPSELEKAGIASVTRIGDCFAPGAIVHAVHSGHRFARELDRGPSETPYARDYPIWTRGGVI